MLTPQSLADAYGRNIGIIKKQAAGLTHEDSVLQPASRGNCLNWVLGHIVDSRNNVLRLVDAEPALDPAIATRYASGSEPVLTDGDGIVSLEELLAALDRSQEALAAKLAAMTNEESQREVPFFSRTMPLGEVLFFLYFHETYHTGQTEPLRQLAGTDDKVI